MTNDVMIHGVMTCDVMNHDVMSHDSYAMAVSSDAYDIRMVLMVIVKLQTFRHTTCKHTFSNEFCRNAVIMLYSRVIYNMTAL